MDKHGNVYMFPDPLVFKMPTKSYTGLEIAAHSTMVPGLRWVDFAYVLVGLEQVFRNRRLHNEMHVKMYDHPSGLQMGELDLYKVSAIHSADPAALT